MESYTAVVVNLLELRAWREWIKLVLRDNQFRNEVPQSSLEVHYDPIFNTIVIPGALLNPPVYTDGLSPAFNFGSLGFVIATKMMSSLIFEDGHQQFSQRDGHQHGGNRSFLQGVSRLHEKIRRGVRAQQSQELGPDPKPAVLHLICYDLVRERSSDVPTCFRHDHVDTVVSDEVTRNSLRHTPFSLCCCRLSRRARHFSVSFAV